MTDALTSNEMTDDIRRIADTVEQNGGWHIAALKLREAADTLDRMREALKGVIVCGSHLEAVGIADRALKGKAWVELCTHGNDPARCIYQECNSESSHEK